MIAPLPAAGWHCGARAGDNPAMGTPSKHVIANLSGGWAVKNAGAARATRVFRTQEEAIAYGRDSARSAQAALYVHAPDGRIVHKSSFAATPLPTQARRK